MLKPEVPGAVFGLLRTVRGDRGGSTGR
jgi:hypothetical protein